MAVYEIPLSPEAQVITVQLGAFTYKLNVYWCVPCQSWNLDLMKEDGTPIINGIPLVTNNNLFEQFDYLDLGGGLYAQTVDAPRVPPTYDNLGKAGKLLFVTT